MTVFDLALFAQTTGRGAPTTPGAGTIIGLMLVPIIIGLLVFVFFTVCMWRIFTKAGEPGWASIVPIYQWMILSKICGRGEMFGLLFLIFCIAPILNIMLMLDLARVFGKGTGFAVGLILLPVIFIPMLAFGDAQYVGDRPSRGTRRRDADDDDDRPRRRRVDDDDDDRPRRRPEDDRVRRSRDDDDDAPRRRPAPRDDDDDDDRPRRRPGGR